MIDGAARSAKADVENAGRHTRTPFAHALRTNLLNKLTCRLLGVSCGRNTICDLNASNSIRVFRSKL